MLFGSPLLHCKDALQDGSIHPRVLLAGTHFLSGSSEDFSRNISDRVLWLEMDLQQDLGPARIIVPISTLSEVSIIKRLNESGVIPSSMLALATVHWQMMTGPETQKKSTHWHLSHCKSHTVK
jgi:hypothetical protein